MQLTWEEFEEKYQPITNHLVKDAPYDGFMFETYGEELEFVKQADPLTIWTVMEGDEDLFVGNGWHFVNRFGYILTKIPFNDEDQIEVIDEDRVDSGEEDE